MYQVKVLIFNNGERYPILIGGDGMPHLYATLWVTVKLRSQLVNTIVNKLNALKLLFIWESKRQRCLYSEFQRGKFLSEKDIDDIKAHLTIDVNHATRVTVPKHRNKIVYCPNSPKPVTFIRSVGNSHLYNRITTISEYLDFISKLATQYISNAKLNSEISLMHTRIKASRPKGFSKHVRDNRNDKEVPDGLIDEFVEITIFDHPKNPFRHTATRIRNHLMIRILRETGIRRGELLSLTLTNIVLYGEKKTIFVKRTHDDKYDPRIDQPVAKTKERIVRISPQTAKLLEEYISKVRSVTPNANKHPYLFVTHKKGRKQGCPISISTFDNTIFSAIKAVDERFLIIHPHYFRHNWNLDFSREIDEINKEANRPGSGMSAITEDKENKMRMDAMGHTSEKSGIVYNRRHIKEIANTVILKQQEKYQHILDNAITEKKEK